MNEWDFTNQEIGASINPFPSPPFHFNLASTLVFRSRTVDYICWLHLKTNIKIQKTVDSFDFVRMIFKANKYHISSTNRVSFECLQIIHQTAIYRILKIAKKKNRWSIWAWLANVTVVLFLERSLSSQWSLMLRLEWEEGGGGGRKRGLSDIWCLDPTTRQANGTCLGHLRVAQFSASQFHTSELDQFSVRLASTKGFSLFQGPLSYIGVFFLRTRSPSNYT